MRIALYLAALLLMGCDARVPETIDGAMQAYGQNRVAEAEGVLRKIAADPLERARQGPGPSPARPHRLADRRQSRTSAE